MAILSLLLATSLLPGFRIDTGAPNWWAAMFRMPLIFAFMLIRSDVHSRFDQRVADRHDVSSLLESLHAKKDS